MKGTRREREEEKEGSVVGGANRAQRNSQAGEGESVAHRGGCEPESDSRLLTRSSLFGSNRSKGTQKHTCRHTSMDDQAHNTRDTNENNRTYSDTHSQSC